MEVTQELITETLIQAQNANRGACFAPEFILTLLSNLGNRYAETLDLMWGEGMDTEEYRQVERARDTNKALFRAIVEAMQG